MKRTCLFSLAALLALINANMATGQNQERIIFTAYQNFDSRLYVMEADGTVLDYFEYANYRLQDFVVIDNEVYVADAFIPCVYKVDISNGELQLVMHDIWLYYFYGLAWDGTYFYVDEWDMNRYDIEGNKDGMAPFDEDVMGSEFADGYYWMINDENQIKAWDFSAWPELTEMPDLHFAPPSPQCRGLWFDGEFFWSAESIEGNLGLIYRFGFDGQVVEQWMAPAFQGWGACKVEVPVGMNKIEKPDFALTVNPNPASTHLDISFTLEVPDKIRLELYDLLGHKCLEQKLGWFQSGLQSHHLFLNGDLKPGSYILRLLTSSHECRQTLVINR